MINVIVQRSPADNQGPDITNALISTDTVAIAHGTAEIDENYSDRIIVSGSMPLHAYIEPGTIVRVIDLQLGTYTAMVETYSCSIQTSNGRIAAITNIVLERVK